MAEIPGEVKNKEVEWPLSNDALVRLINGARAEVAAFRSLFLSVQAVALAAPALMKDLGMSTLWKLLILALWIVGMAFLMFGLIRITPQFNMKKQWKERNRPGKINKREEITEFDIGGMLLSAAIARDKVNCRERLKKALQMQQALAYNIAKSRISYVWGAGFVVISLIMLVLAREFLVPPEGGAVSAIACGGGK